MHDTHINLAFSHLSKIALLILLALILLTIYFSYIQTLYRMDTTKQNVLDLISSRSIITKFILVDASTNQDIQPLTDGVIITMSNLPTQDLVVRADVAVGSTEQVVFQLNETQLTDTNAPFTIEIVSESYVLTATPYQAASLTDINYDNYGYNPARNLSGPPANATRLYPGDDIQAAVDAHPAGTVFVLSAGMYRLQEIEPKDGNQFYGEDGAILSGARVLTDFQRENDLWYVDDQTQQAYIHGFCEPDRSRCKFAEDLFFDGLPFLHVNSLKEVTIGSWYFDYDNDRIYFADNPTDRLVETSVATYAFHGFASNIVVANLIIEHYANLAQTGAIQGDEGKDWIVRDNIIQWNHGTGLRVGENMLASNNLVINNGQLGIAGTGNNSTVEWNNMGHNNYAGYTMLWEAGGAKFVGSNNLIIRNNYVYDNEGPGLWTDTDNINVLIESNLVMNNARMGIFHETSYDAVINNNIVISNSPNWYPWVYGSQILIATSSNTEVYNNYVVTSENGGNGLTFLEQNRGSGIYGVWETRNNFAYNNIVVHLNDDALSGIASDYNQSSLLNHGNNRFDNNMYYVTNPNDTYWSWSTGPISFGELQTLGQEDNGQVLAVDDNGLIAGTPLSITFTLIAD